jgi:hypothetical protein
MSTPVNNKPAKSTPTPSASSNNTSAYAAQKRHKLNKPSSNDEQDGLLFNSLLGEVKQNENTKTMQDTHNAQNSYLFLQEQETKKDDEKIKSITQDQAKSVDSIQQADKSYTAEFCQALQDNHEKHNFEVNLPKIGKFNIGTERSGNKMHFSVSSKEKLACDWLTTHQSSIEKNVGQDLNMDVSLGIQHVV